MNSARKYGWKIHLPETSSLVSQNGFVSDKRNKVYQINDTAVNASITYKYNHNMTALYEVESFGEYGFDGGSWAVVPLPRSTGRTGTEYRTPTGGEVGEYSAYLGNYTKYSTSRGCHEISIVVAESASMDEDPETVLQSLTYADRQLKGDRDPHVTFFVAPVSFGTDGIRGVTYDSDVVIKSNETDVSSSAHSVIWTHEYVHTRQHTSLGEEIRWWTEASATSVGNRLALESGYITPRKYNKRLRDRARQTDGVVLSNSSTWSKLNSSGEYGRGIVVLASWAEKTNSTMSVVTLFNSIESQSRVTLQSFTTTAEVQTGEDLGEWVEFYIRSDTPVDELPLVETSLVPFISDKLLPLAIFGIILVLGIAHFTGERDDGGESVFIELEKGTEIGERYQNLVDAEGIDQDVLVRESIENAFEKAEGDTEEEEE